MSIYQAPLADMRFNLFQLWKVQQFWSQNSTLAEIIEADTASAILEEAGKITAELIAPKAQLADDIGVKWQAGEVTTPDHYKTNYQQLCEGGWTALSGDPEYGGMGMPKSLATLYEEMMCSADIAFSLYSGLTAGACVTLLQYADETTKQHILPKLYSGEWSATMCLTEAHAGSDLGIMRTQAKPQSDGSYLISGSKIFITAGEHDLTDNIIHLVLAKLPDAPAGSRGISLFLVSKFMLDATGNKTIQRNSLQCGSVEHKMGIHASASCVMNFDDAKGYLLGEPHKGLAAMFTMMNYERLAMGSQGVGAAERALQNARLYANDRLQGRVTTQDANKADPIIQHPDVQRMLLTVKALTEAGRTFSVYVAHQLDRAKFADDQQALAVASLLTPVTKAFLTDRGFESCVMAQQVFGGHGYIKEWGMEQWVRDVRIAQIYEGTNGIQALDFAGRKLFADGGAAIHQILDEIATGLNQNPQPALAALLQQYQQLIAYLTEQKHSLPALLQAHACDLLDLTGYLLYGHMWNKTLAALSECTEGDEFIASKRQTADFYFSRIMPRAYGYLQIVQQSLMPVNPALI
jgi:hypothetical protein